MNKIISEYIAGGVMRVQHTWDLAEVRSQEFVVAFLWVSEVQGAETYCNQMYKCTHRHQTTHKIVISKRTTKSVSTHPILQYISEINSWQDLRPGPPGSVPVDRRM